MNTYSDMTTKDIFFRILKYHVPIPIPGGFKGALFVIVVGVVREHVTPIPHDPLYENVPGEESYFPSLVYPMGDAAPVHEAHAVWKK